MLLLLMVAGVGAGLAATGVVWSQAAQRENEQELLRHGESIKRAIAQYYERSPGLLKRYPQNLDELLLDKRHLTLQRYLRRIPFDPMTRSEQWGTVRAPDGGIMGVFSLSPAQPIKISNSGKNLAGFSNAQRYSDWRFVYVPQIQTESPKSIRY